MTSGDDAGASMSGNLASNDLHVAGRLNEHNAGLLSVKRSNHGVGSVVNDSAFGKGNVQDFIGDGGRNLHVGDSNQDDLIGHRASASAELPGRRRNAQREQMLSLFSILS